MFSFLILIFLSGVIELGSVYIGIVHKLPIYMIIVLPLFYQVGNIMLSIIPSRMMRDITFACLVLFLSFSYCIYPSFWILAVQLAFDSYCIQLVRMQHKSLCPTWLKRSFRIGGFALSPIMLLGGGQIILSLSALICILLILRNFMMRKDNKEIVREKKTKKVEVSMVMIFHQMHYFVYTYIMPIYVYQITGSVILSCFAFSLTWVLYLLPQTIAEKYNNVNYKRMFFFCHFFLAVCMVIMAISAYFNRTAIVLLFWMLTGIGGGSVFCIRYLCKKYEYIDMSFSENIGHFGGTLIAVLLCFIFIENAVAVLTAVSSLFVVIALIWSLYIVGKEYFYEK